MSVLNRSRLGWSAVVVALAACGVTDRQGDVPAPPQDVTAGASAPPPMAASSGAGTRDDTSLARAAGAGGAARSAAGAAGTTAFAASAAAAGQAAAVPAVPQASTPSASPTTPAAVSCPDRYTLAMRVRLDMQWDDAVGWIAGHGNLQAWSKVTRDRDGARVEQVPCGIALPAVTTSPLLDGIQLSNAVPTEAFDRPTMPRAAGSVQAAGDTSITESTVVLGATLPDPLAAWPTRKSLVLADHDGDGEPGVTAFARADAPFGLPPTDIGQTEHADRVYIAARMRIKASLPETSCKAPASGKSEPLGFNYTIVGCHAKDRDDCKENEVNLLENNSPAFVLSLEGVADTVPIAETASCVEVVAALPGE